MVTWSMLGLPFALIRPIVAFFTGIGGGLLTNRIDKKNVNLPSKKTSHSKVKFSIKTILHYAFVEMVADIAKWLVVGLLIAALITVLVPDNFFTEFHLGGISGMLLILIVSIPLYICATSSVPIAAVLLLKGLSPGALLVFLMAGPATNAATITVIGKNLGRKTLIAYLSSIVIGSLFFGVIVDNFLPPNWFAPLSYITGDHQHELLPYWLMLSSTILLVIMLLYSFINSFLQYRRNITTKSNIMHDSVSIEELTINVEGMTCGNCKAKVENEIRKMPKIISVIADMDNNSVKIRGHELSTDEIGSKIENIGYRYNGVVSDPKTSQNNNL